MEIERFDVYLINLGPAIDHELEKARPCLIISPNEMNRFISTVIVAPMTTNGRNYPTRIQCTFQGKKSQIILDQIRTVDKKKFIKKLGSISKKARDNTLNILQEMFAT